jgi:hypothetical protein
MEEAEENKLLNQERDELHNTVIKLRGSFRDEGGNDE